jgi:hypothetical protein
VKLDKKTIIAVVLGLVAVGVVIYQFAGVALPSKNTVSAAVTRTPSAAKINTQPAAVAQVTRVSQAGEDYDDLIAEVSESDLAYRSPAFRNPMLPLIPDPKAIQFMADLRPSDRDGSGPIDAVAMGYSIQGIIWNKVEPLALINNQVVGVGEALDDGAIVTEITPDTAKFIKKGKNYFLVFREE